MRKNQVEPGQISIFDISIVTQKKEIKTESIESNSIDIANKILRIYKGIANKILKLWGGRYSVELEDETIYFNKAGKEDYRSKLKREIIALDEILFSKIEEVVNETQKQVLEDMQQKYKLKNIIKRYGDKNYIVITENNKVYGINRKGWIIPYDNTPEFKNNVNYNNEIKVGDSVEIEYKSQKYLGKIHNVYESGNTINVIFDGKHTAFHKSKVKLVS